MTTEATCLCSGYVLSHLSMAAFDPIIYGRFWVITEVQVLRTRLDRALNSIRIDGLGYSVCTRVERVGRK